MKSLLLLFATIFMSLIQADKKAIRYIALGDSYTICTGTNQESEAWPSILAEHLRKSGIPVSAVSNPSRNGFSTQQLIDHELPLLKEDPYDFATLLIGVNDWVREVDIRTYQRNLSFIIDEIQKSLSDRQNLLIITIPDFGVTPKGALYGGGRNISQGISAFNSVIRGEAKKRGLVCVDLFPVSKGMLNHAELIAADGLHPSANEYALWEKLIFPEAKKILSRL